MSEPLASYINGGYHVAIYSNGTKIRYTADETIPPVHPEQMDLKITDWCDAGCFWCHEKSTKRGKHGDVDAMLRLLAELPEGVEIAIGGGDPLSHPEFERLVRGLRQIGLIPSVTVNGRHFERHRDTLTRLTGDGVLFGVGVSFYKEVPDWEYEHMVVHMIAGVDDPSALEGLSRKKVLVLGYKDFGRGSKYKAKRPVQVQQNLAKWYRSLFWLAKDHHLSFDTLAIKLLKPKRLFKDPAVYDMRYMGDEGEFSIYIDGVLQEFALSSYSPQRGKWSNMRDMFAMVRNMRDAERDASNE